MSTSMKTIVITDIFGKTVPLMELAFSIGQEILIFDPYNGNDMSFRDENEAYLYFQSNVGVPQYSHGFMNKFSQNFDIEGYNNELQTLARCTI